MIVTIKEQMKLLAEFTDKFTIKTLSADEIDGFIDGMNAMLSLVDKKLKIEGVVK